MRHYYRLYDVIVQIMLLATWLVTFIVKFDWVIYFYFIVGGWFFISLFIHLAISGNEYEKVYTPIAVFVLVAVALAMIGLFAPGILFAEGLILLFISPFIALLYTFNCIHEIRRLRKRPLSFLK